MTKKDLELIAGVLVDAKEHVITQERGRMLYIIAHDFADRLAGDNPRFDRARFLAACGVEG